MPNYNGGRFIEKSILSFIDNQYTNKELIIFDSKSKDDSHTIIERYSNDLKSIKWLNSGPDRGISEAINTRELMKLLITVLLMLISLLMPAILNLWFRLRVM